MKARVEKLFRNPKEVSLSDLKILKSEIEKYPYMQVTRALYLYGVHTYDIENYPKLLSETAAYTTDKKILYQLINGKNKTIFSQEHESENSNNKNQTVGSQSESDVLMINNEATSIDENEQKVSASHTLDFEFKEENIELDNHSQLSYHRTEDYLPKVEFKVSQKSQEYQPQVSQDTKLTRHEMEMKKLIAEVEAKMKLMKISRQEKKDIKETKNILSSEINFLETTAFVVNDSDKVVESHTDWKPMNFDEDTLNPLVGKKEEMIEEEKVIETSSESNVFQFINTWQSWLKIGEVETNGEQDVCDTKNNDEGNGIEEDIIAKFIENEPKISRPNDENNFVIREKSDDIWHLMTETLANLYAEQRLYSKAIKAFEVLMDKYPDKKGYFKEKIKEIKEIRSNK